MNNRRSILRLLVAIIVLGLLHFALEISGGGSNSRTRRAVLVPNADFASRIELMRNDSTPFVLEKSGRSWSFIEPFSANADDAVIARLLDRLAFTPLIASIADAELLRLGRQREDFELERPRLKMRLQINDTTTELAFGTEVPDAGGIYAAIEGIDSVFIAPTNMLRMARLNPMALRNRSLSHFTPGQIIAFDLKSGTGSFASFYREGETWQQREPRQSAAAQTQIKKLLETIIDSRVRSFVWPIGATNENRVAAVSLLAGYGLDSESSVSILMRSDDGRDETIAIGREAGDGLVYAALGGSSVIVTVNASLKDLIGGDSSRYADSRLFPLQSTAVNTISIEDDNVTYLLARDGKNGWRLDAPVSATADSDAVSAVLDRILSARSSDLDAYGLRVNINAQSSSISIARDVVLGNRSLEDLRSKIMFNADPGTLKRIVISRADSEIADAIVWDSFRRAWNTDTSDGGSTARRSFRTGTVNAIAAADLVAALNPLEAISVVRLKATTSELCNFALDEPRITIAIDRQEEDALRRNILIGAETPEGCYATIGATDAIFLLSTETLRRLSAAIIND